MRDEMSGKEKSSLAGGVVLIVIGALFLADTLEVANFGRAIRDYWPLLIVAVGVSKLFDAERRGGGIATIAVGIWLQISNLGLFGMEWSSSWPLLLILLGAGMVLHAIVDAVSKRGEGREGGDPHVPES